MLFEAIEYVKQRVATGSIAICSQVALSIILILQSLKLSQKISWKDSEKILNEVGLEQFLINL